MNELALFTGAGGGLLGSLLMGWRPICGVEIDRFCREILLRRQRDGLLPLFPIWDDIRTFDGRPWCGKVEVITGGFPRQPWSVAGRKAGSVDSRNLWPDTARIITEVSPRYALLENVPGLLQSQAKGYFSRILSDLSESGYDAVWDSIPAAAVGAPHIRERVFILAVSRRFRSKSRRDNGELEWERFWDAPDTSCQIVADTASAGLSVGQHAALGAPRRHAEPERFDSVGGEWWAVEPDVGRVAHGVVSRMNRLRALGNGQVPSVVVLAWETLMERVRLMERYG